MYNETETDLIILSCIEELSYKHRSLLLSQLQTEKPDFEKFKFVLIKSLTAGVYNKIKNKFYGTEFRRKALSELEKKQITCVTYFSDNYPEMLRETPFPPTVLFCKGNVSLLKTRCFSVVGSRRTTDGALAACRQICMDLTEKFTVVTGMADGADTAAIAGAIGSGKCVSVLAHGFDHTYPAVNEDIKKKVGESGLLISEYPPSVKPQRYMFPVRNRIIAGMSEAALVVSAGERSGALITAEYALEYGRTLFAFPYGIGVSSGKGCNSLIKKGAFLTENILDIFSVFGLDFNLSEPEKLSADEQRLLEIFRRSGETFIGAAAAEMNRQPYELIPLLSSLEIKKLIIGIGGNRYAAL